MLRSKPLPEGIYQYRDPHAHSLKSSQSKCYLVNGKLEAAAETSEKGFGRSPLSTLRGQGVQVLSLIFRNFTLCSPP